MLEKVKQFGQRFVIAKHEAQIDRFNVGDTITVGLKIVDGGVVRVQDFTGVCIAYRKKGVGTNFIVRKMSGEVAVERNVILYSPLVAYVKLVKQGVVRRAKLYYMRNLCGKAARIKEKVVIKTTTENNTSKSQTKSTKTTEE